MTIFLILGLFVGLYALWLLFSLAVYAFPAGVAGYHAALGIAGLVFGHGLLPGVICWLAAITIAVAAWRQIVLAEHNPVLAEQVRRAP